MSVTTEGLVAPSDQWLAEGQWSAEEIKLAGVIHERGSKARTATQAALALGAAFILLRRVVSRRMKEEAAKEPLTDVQLIRRLGDSVLSLVLPRWALVAAPALASGYWQGLRGAQHAALNPEWVASQSEAYAARLGAYLHETSMEALVEGFTRQVNRRVAARVALDRVIDAYGIAPRTTKALVNIWLTPPAETAVHSQVPAKNRALDRADKLIAAALEQRAQAVGTTEIYSAKAQAKQVLWMYQLDSGHLPRTATKRWRTARDEKVCPSCGPMHQRSVPIDEQFETPGRQRVWGPPLHVNCRCDITLQVNAPAEGRPEPALVAKRSDDPYNRDDQGRFASRDTLGVRGRERRVAPVRRVQPVKPVKERTTNPQVQRLLAQVQQQTQVSRPVVGRSEVSRPSLQRRAQLDRVQVSRPQVSRPQVSRPQASKPGLERAKVGLRKPGTRRPLDMRRLNLDKIKAQAPASIPVLDNDKWENLPKGERLYGIFPAEHSFDIKETDDRSLLLADDYVPWYSDSSMNTYGVATLGQGLAEYWGEQVFNDLYDRYIAHGDEFPEGRPVVRFADRAYYVPFDAYEDAWSAAISGVAPFETNTTLVLDIQTGDETEVNQADLADKLGLYDEVEDMVPIIAVADKVNKHEQLVEGMGATTNPGKWRITGQYKDNTAAWRGREHYLPYRMYYVEPDDLFD